MLCKLCGKEKKLIKSHIIPKSFYREAYRENEGIMVRKDDHSKRRRMGVYDKEIVCADCEKIFQEWDDYGYKFFYEILTSLGKAILSNGKSIGLHFEDIKYKELKLFLMSVLWRAAVSGDEFFNEISLGPFEENLKKMILSSNPGDSEEFACMISKFNIDKADVLHPPCKVRLDNEINGYRVFFFNSEVFIKVDKRTIGKNKFPLLNPEPPLTVVIKDPPKTVRLLNEARNDKYGK